MKIYKVIGILLVLVIAMVSCVKTTPVAAYREPSEKLIDATLISKIGKTEVWRMVNSIDSCYITITKNTFGEQLNSSISCKVH